MDKKLTMIFPNQWPSAYSAVADLILKNKNRPDTDLLYMKAFLAQKMNWHTVAIEHCNQVLKIDPQNLEALHAKLVSCEILNYHAESFKVYNQILAILPNDPASLLGKAKYFFRNSKFDECNKVCARLLNIKTDSVEVLEPILNFFEVFLRKRKEIIMICDKILAIDNKNITAYTKKAYALLSISEYKRAIITCNEVLLQDNNNTMAILIKMNALEALGKYREVLKLCNKLLTKLNINNANVLIIKATMFAYLKDYSNSIQTYETIIKICESKMFYVKKNKDIEDIYNNAKIQLNVMKINSNRQLTIMEGFDFLVNYLLILLLKF